VLVPTTPGPIPEVFATEWPVEPRLTGEYVDLTAAPALLAELAASLGERLGVPYDRIWMNW
jgi:hypothetical protein